ncbi:hypothetical protein ACFP2T_41960 [Plantactinospora solaniradicis]|uniref:Uncharacterized protein n=1 Tax=Plantactinospora solaniradicis TaxID=1723736 RepID=A0ABW1KLL4_9ACTN
MSSRDSSGTRGGASPPTTPAPPTSDDAEETVKDQGVEAFPDTGGSKYPPRGPGRPASEPLKVRVELIVVDDPAAAKELLKRQAAVVKEALQWFADNPPDAEGDESP